MLQPLQRRDTGRRGRRAVGVLCLLLAVAGMTTLALVRPSPSAPADLDWAEVLYDGDDALELVLRSPALEWRDREPHVPGFGRSGEPGMPIEFGRTVLVAVPSPEGAVLEILDQESERHADVVPPRLVPDTEPEAAATPAREWRGQRPATAVSLLQGGRLRGRDVVTLVYTPLLFAADGSATHVRSAHVRLRFAARPTAGEPPRVPEALHAACLNATTALRWPLHFERQKAAIPTTALPDRRVRLRIARTGLYAINYTRLRSVLGDAELEQLDPMTLQIYADTWAPVPLRADSVPASWQPQYEPQEIAIWVEGETDRSFDVQDRIVFYALGPKDYMDLTGLRADSLLHGQNPYDNVQYAWLVWGDSTVAARIDSVTASEPGTPADLVRSSWYRLHFETDAQFGTVDDLWFWDELRAQNPFYPPDFAVDLAGAARAPAQLRLGTGATSFVPGYTGRHAVRVLLNSETLGDVRWQQFLSTPPNHYAALPCTLAGNNRLQLSLVEWDGTASDPTKFLKFDLTWDRPLVLPAAGPEVGRLRWSRRPVAADEAYEVSGFTGTSPWFLDVTEPHRPRRLTAPTPVAPGTWRLRYGRGAGVRTHFLAVSAPTLLDAADLVPRTVRPLRSPASSPDMVVITHASLLSQAQRLAQHRAAHFPGAATLGHAPDVQVVDVTDIYENFSGGRSDPLAIRNYLKLLYTQPLPPGETVPRLRYALLFGEATHDPRRLAPGSTPTLVPTVHAWYVDPMDAGSPTPVPAHLRRWWAVEDWLGEMDRPQSAGLSSVYALPDLGVGRLTPRTITEAERLVDKIVDYDLSTDFDAWRMRVLLSADDECKFNYCGETAHVTGIEQLVPLTPVEWDIVKIYLTEYPAVFGQQKPQGRAAFIRAWSDGCALVSYQGHGAPRQLADEVLFLSTDIPELTNGRRLPVFMAFSCTVAEFDAPELQSMCEDLIGSASGGAIAAMGATHETYSDDNRDFNAKFWQAIFADGPTSKVAIGTVYQLAKTRASAYGGDNNERYVFLGDPAMTLLAPEALVTWTSGADSLEAGRSTRVEGMVHLPGTTTPLLDFDGTADVEVRGTADDSGYQSASPPFFVRIAYDLPGPPLYRGRVTVRDGRLQFQFVVPLGARLGNKARLGAYAAAGGVDAKGAVGTVRVVRAAAPDSSLGPPRISLFFPNNVTKVKPGTELVGEIRDENGINIQGTTLPSSILLDFDDRNQPLNVTDQFRYADGSDSVGTVRVPLPEGLEPGPHKATMIASDNLQNRSTESLGFDVVPASAELMANVIAFPNPFKDRTYFFFELTDPADVQVRVFSAAGREVWHTSQFVDTPQQVSIRWDGIDFARDPVANGTYLYRVEARPRRTTPGDGPVLKHVGKVVVMRD